MKGSLRKSLGMTLFLLSAIFGLFFFRASVSPVPLTSAVASDLPLFDLLSRLQNLIPSYIEIGVIVLLALFSSVLFTRIMVRNLIYQERTYLPGVIFVVTAYGTAMGEYSFISAATTFLLIWSCDMMILSFRREMMLGMVFNSALLLGICLLIDSHTLIWIPMFACAMIIFRKSWRDWLACLTGLLIPFTITSYVFWGMGESIDKIALTFFTEVSNSINYAGPFIVVGGRNAFLFIFWGTTILAAVASLIWTVRGSELIRTRPFKTYMFFVWMLLFSIPLLIIPGRSVTDFALIAIPLTAIISAYLGRSSERFAIILYAALLLSVIVYNFIPLISI